MWMKAKATKHINLIPKKEKLTLRRQEGMEGVNLTTPIPLPVSFFQKCIFYRDWSPAFSWFVILWQKPDHRHPKKTLPSKGPSLLCSKTFGRSSCYVLLLLLVCLSYNQFYLILQYQVNQANWVHRGSKR